MYVCGWVCFFPLKPEFFLIIKPFFFLDMKILYLPIFVFLFKVIKGLQIGEMLKKILLKKNIHSTPSHKVKWLFPFCFHIFVGVLDFPVLVMKIWIYLSESNFRIYFYIALNKNWKIYLSEQSFNGLGLEDRWSLWVLFSLFSDIL